MTEQVCIRCKHPRRGHSREGCKEYIDNKGTECTCKVKYMDKGMFQ
jgi:hypothetical protein